MLTGIKIPKNDKKIINKKIKIYNKPKLVYIPLVSQNDTNITVMVKKGDYVYKGSIIGKRKGKLRIPIHSSVSGTVIDFEEKTYINGSKVRCAVIENDFKEKIEKKPPINKRINNYTKEEFIEIIKELGVIGLGGSGFPTYIKYDTEQKINTLLVNAIECEPYVTADHLLGKEKSEEILEAIDAVLEINGIPEAIIAIRKDNTDLKNTLLNFIGTYPKIKIKMVSNTYPMGWERTLIKEIKHINYGRLPIEKGLIVNNISTMYSIYEALKYRKPLIERIVTFTGDVLKEPHNVFVKIGTPVSEVIEYLGGYKRYKDINLIAGGPMMGVTVTDDLIISGNLICVLVLKDNKTDIPLECLRCGKCADYCPSKITPVLIKDNLKNLDNLKKLQPELCVECGLCSYVCPAKINVRECVRQGKKKLMKGENK